LRIRTASLLKTISFAAAFLHAPHLSAEPRDVQTFLRLPLAFERDGNGADERFVARGPGYTVGVQRGKATIGLAPKEEGASSVVSLEFTRSRSPKAEPGPQLPGKVNYIHGNDPTRWRIGLPTWERVRYPDIYPGIDVVYYGNQQQLEFDLVLKPGADPQAIRMKIGGGSKLSFDDSGALRIGTAGGDDLKIQLPNLYQEVNGKRRSVSGRYLIQGRDEVSFHVDSYDRARPLVIDPTIVYSTLFAGNSNSSSSIGVDSSGNILLAGSTWQTDFPAVNAIQGALAGSEDAFVAKINSAGTALIYSTYLGGSNYDQFKALAIDSAGSAWLTGFTESINFPILNAVQSASSAVQMAVVVKLDKNGVLQFSSYLGGTSYTDGQGIAVDGSGNAYVTGNSSDSTFPTTPGTLPFPAPIDVPAFVTKYSSAGALVYSTLLGGDFFDQANAIAVDSAGNAYVTGYSASSTFAGAPSGGAQPANEGNQDAFVAKLNSNATALLYFTFLGGSGSDQGKSIAVNSSGEAYIGGITGSAGLATPGAAQTVSVGTNSGFIAKLNAAGSAFEYVTYIGGDRADSVASIALDNSGNIYAAGNTNSENFPLADPLQPALPGNGTSLFSSTDSGATWNPSDLNIPGIVSGISVNPAGTSAVVATDTGIYRTVDGGNSWALQSSSATYGYVLARSLASPTIIYTSVCCSPNFFGTNPPAFYKSADDGVTWSYVGFPIGGNLLVDPLDANTIYAFDTPDRFLFNGPNIYKSTDGGVIWNSVDTGIPADVQAMAATSDGTIYAAMSGYGIFRSTNQGSSWTPVNGGLPANASVGLNSLTASGTTVYFASGPVYKTTSASSSWTLASGSVDAVQIAAFSQNPSILYALTEQNTVQQSLNGGTTWSAGGVQLPPPVSGFGSGLFADPGNSARAYFVASINQAAFVSKLNSAGSALLWSTYLGGLHGTSASGLATNSQGSVFVTGSTDGVGFPVTSSALLSGSYPAYITEISDATASCSFAINPATATIPPNSQTLTFDVVAPGDCSWTASVNDSWAFITGGASGIGTGSITLQIDADTDATRPDRAVVLTAGGQNVTITQAGGGCSYALDKASYTVPGVGGAISVVLTATAGCPWTVGNNNAGAITITAGASGTGSATINLTLTPNLTTSERDFSLSVGTTQIQIAQPTSLTSLPLQLITMTPCRVMDTRNSEGPLGGPFLSSGMTRTIPMTASSCGIPANAAAYALNVTVVPRTGTLGYLTVWPAGQAQPLVSTLNSLDGSVLANAAIVPAGTSGSIDAFATDETDLVIDIDGYFVPPNNTGAGLQFFPLTPCRVLDTRNPDGDLGGPFLTAGIVRSFPITSSPCGALPRVPAYSLNVTVVPHGSLGYLTAWPTGQTQPLASTLNSLNGTVLANAAIVPAGDGGSVSFFATNDTDLVVDINGFFAPPELWGFYFYTVNPCRLVDTRHADGTFGSPVMGGQTTRSFALRNASCGLPSSAQAYSLNMTVVPQAPTLGYLSTWPAGGTQPVVSTLNALNGQVVANAAIVPAGAGGAIDVFVTDTAQIVIDTNGYFAP
jgi:hypothetical protein